MTTRAPIKTLPISSTEQTIEHLLQDMAALRREIIELRSEKADLELRLEMTTYHSDYVADELFAKVEITLQESLKRFRSIAEAMPVPIIISQIADGQIVYANGLAAPLVGLTDEPEDKKHYTLGFYGDPGERRQLLEQLNRYGFVNDYEIQAKKADGTPFWVSVSIQPLHFDNQPCLLSAFFDLTERRKNEVERVHLTAIQQELRLAQQIQERLLPPTQPNWEALEVVCYMAPARNVAGDFYAYAALPPSPEQPQDDRVALAVGDVSGKGMPAALLMSLSFASLQAIIDQSLPPVELLSRLDQTITQYTQTTQQNCALSYAEFTVPAEIGHPTLMKAVNVGCVQPLVRRVDGSLEWVRVAGLPLGSRVDQAFYDSVSVTLYSGDIVILSSDGVVEAMSKTQEIFGFTRFEQTVSQGPASSATAMLAYIQAEIAEFTQQTEVQDDLTLIVIRIKDRR